MTPDDVEKIAKLARLKLSTDEIQRLTGELGQILEYVEILNEVDTTDVQPMAHAVEQSNVFRADEVRPSLDRAAALQNAPKSNGEFFVVPKILDGAG